VSEGGKGNGGERAGGEGAAIKGRVGVSKKIRQWARAIKNKDVGVAILKIRRENALKPSLRENPRNGNYKEATGEESKNRKPVGFQAIVRGREVSRKLDEHEKDR